MRSNSLLAAVMLVAVLLVHASAHASEEEGRTLFAKGRQQRLSGQCAEAIVSFRLAHKAFPEGLGSLRNIAECQQKLGRYAAARRSWWNLRRAVLTSTDPKYRGWDEDAMQAYAALETKVATVTIDIVGADRDAVTVTVDGKPLAGDLIGVELERDLGERRIELSYGGASPMVKVVRLTEGQHERVLFEVPSTRTADGSDGDSGGGLLVGGVVAIGAGAAAGIAAIVSAVVRQNALNDIERDCPHYLEQPCPPSVSSARSRGETATTLVNAFTIVGAAGLAVGIPLLIVGLSSDADVGGDANVTLSVNAGRRDVAAGLSVRF